VDGVFAAGDFVTGPSTVVEAMASGKKAAQAVDRYLEAKEK
jgi:NADPH-dependent glutamate synthase beta subunit-like oxidoreductase